MSKQSSKRGRKKGGAYKSEEQAQVLLNWAVEEMGLSTEALPTLTDLNTYVPLLL